MVWKLHTASAVIAAGAAAYNLSLGNFLMTMIALLTSGFFALKAEKEYKIDKKKEAQ
jgi:Na+/pantothenate symporter